ncbi:MULTISPECIES: hypothetical protein [unclassified Mesorhizobium]|uniref:hypothetical protein n=1 Tax=unclassified Mesorhizobium TaxID=325217 RepID=UPI001FED80FF|nr:MULTISPECIES: hypothetical protein [unclassified Mesorhizobium]
MTPTRGFLARQYQGASAHDRPVGAAGANRGLVIGTDHAAEALMGFFTKFGEGAADILPLSGFLCDAQAHDACG